MEEYLELREQGFGRRRAGKILFEKGMDETYPYFLDKTFQIAVARAKSLFKDPGDIRTPGIAWIYEVTGKDSHPILSLNQFCLYKGVNAICFTRYSIIIFKKKKAKKRFSHNRPSCSEKKVVLDFW